jgi:competence protein ComEC
VPQPPGWVAAIFLVTLLAAAFAVASGNRWRIAGTLTSFAVACGLVVVHPFPPQLARRSLEITAIDVGQGDSLLVATPEGRTMLVDGGGFSGFGQRTPSALDSGEDIVSPYLWSRSIRHLDAIVVTHAHEDHIGGLAALIENFHPAELWTGADPSDDPRWRSLVAGARQQGVRLKVHHAGESFSWGGAAVDVLWPDAGHVSQPRTRNNDSLVLRLGYGSTSFLLTGDIESAVERSLVAAGTLRQADVLKIAHHGSRSSTTAEFLEEVRPTFAVLSAGFQNVHRFPHHDVIERLSGTRTTLRRTDWDGLVTIRSDGRRIEVDTYREAWFSLLPPILID